MIPKTEDINLGGEPEVWPEAARTQLDIFYENKQARTVPEKIAAHRSLHAHEISVRSATGKVTKEQELAVLEHYFLIDRDLVAVP